MKKKRKAAFKKPLFRMIRMTFLIKYGAEIGLTIPPIPASRVICIISYINIIRLSIIPYCLPTGVAVITSVFRQREKVVVGQRRPGGIVAFHLQLILGRGHQSGHRELSLVPQIVGG